MVNFYNHFIPRAAHLMRPLDEALRGRKASRGGGVDSGKAAGYCQSAKAALTNAGSSCSYHWHFGLRCKGSLGGQCLAAPGFLQQEPS